MMVQGDGRQISLLGMVGQDGGSGMALELAGSSTGALLDENWSLFIFIFKRITADRVGQEVQHEFQTRGG